MKKFTKNIILIIFPFTIAVVVINYFVDPANVFSQGKYEKKIASIILQGHNVDNINNCDERELNFNLVSELRYKPDVVVMGSSRSLEISSNFFPNKTLLNVSVSHANINDIISLVGLLDSFNKFPKEIYIETSSVFANPNPTYEWLSLYPFYKLGYKKMNLGISSITPKNELINISKKIKALVSFEYFQESIKSLNLFSSQEKLMDVGLNQPKNLGRLADGSITYPLSYRTPDTIKAISDAKLFMFQNKLPVISVENINIFEKIIIYLKNKGVKVNLLNLPFQLDCYAYYKNTNVTFDIINKGILTFATKNKVSILGTFNPLEAKLNRSQFYDPLHCNVTALKTIINIMKYIPVDSAK